MTRNAVSFESLGFAYHPGHWVFRGCTGKVDQGKVFALLGPGGCGKTTLLKVLLGALLPQEGMISHRGRFAFLPHQFPAGFSCTALDLVAKGRTGRMGFSTSLSGGDQQAALAALHRLKLDPLATRPFESLSCSQRQMVRLAQALASEAEILLFDEPTSTLGRKDQAIMAEWLIRLAREEDRTVLLTTRHPGLAWAAADMTMLMVPDQAPLCGPTRKVVSEDWLPKPFPMDPELALSGLVPNPSKKFQRNFTLA